MFSKKISLPSRPIPLLTVSSQLLKEATHYRFSQHLHTNNIPVTEQYGFRKGISTKYVAFRLTDNTFNSINQKMQVEGIFCDLAKASDCVNHEILLAKLYFYGI
jgi:hypothetical protein